MEIIVPFSPSSRSAVTHVRSTLIASSLTTLRQRGHYERYLESLPEEHHEIILNTLAPSWIAMDHAFAHYGACDELHLSNEELLEIGKSVGSRIQATFLGTLSRRARDVGVAPWLIMGQYQRLWDRLMQGGGVQVAKKGPKDAVVTVSGLPLCQFAYFRHAFLGVNLAAIGLFARSHYGRLVPRRTYSDAMEVTFSWV